MHLLIQRSLLGIILVTHLLCNGVIAEEAPVSLLDEKFSEFRAGLLMDAVGAHTEYHYLSHASQRGPWAVSAFKSNGSQRAWRVIEEDGGRAMLQA